MHDCDIIEPVSISDALLRFFRSIPCCFSRQRCDLEFLGLYPHRFLPFFSSFFRFSLSKADLAKKECSSLVNWHLCLSFFFWAFVFVFVVACDPALCVPSFAFAHIEWRQCLCIFYIFWFPLSFFPCSASAMTACGRCSVYIGFLFLIERRSERNARNTLCHLFFSLHMFSLSIRAAFFKGTCWSYVRAPIFSLVRRRFTPALCGFLLYGGARCHNGWSRPSINKHNDLKNERHALRYASWSERAKG